MRWVGVGRAVGSGVTDTLTVDIGLSLGAAVVLGWAVLAAGWIANSLLVLAGGAVEAARAEAVLANWAVAVGGAPAEGGVAPDGKTLNPSPHSQRSRPWAL